jgi:crotonobetainyl-CoA:carnitine CoA-transferase CaiB-like acyl-CoA transferase
VKNCFILCKSTQIVDMKRIEKPFSGLKVVELASVLAGPAVGMFFAELGATVTKIENASTNGDVTRTWRLPIESAAANDSAYFYSVNYAKKHLFLDLENAEARAQTLDLIAQSDIVISNFKTATAQRWGLDAGSLQARGLDKLIYAQLYSYSETDETPAFDVVLQAETGFMFLNGERDGAAVKMPVALIDVLAAHQLKEAILIALWQRERTGKGALVSTSLYQSAIASLVNQASNYLMNDMIPQRIGSEHPNIAPYGDCVFTHDAQAVVLACGTERHFRELCKILKIKEIAPEFANNQRRVQNRKALMQLLQNATTALFATAAELITALKTNGVPAALINDMATVFAQPSAQAMILEEQIGDKVTRRVKSVAFDLKTF